MSPQINITYEQKQKNEIEFDAWIEWKELCDINKCIAENQNILDARAKSCYIKHYYVQTNREPDKEKLDLLYCWNLFEKHSMSKTYSKEGHPFRGKSYKEEIFLTAGNSEDTPLKIFRGRLNNMMRDVLKNIFGKDAAKKNTVSIHEQIAEDITLEELLPSNDSPELPPKEKILARKIAREIFDSLNFEQKMLLFAFSRGLKKSDATMLCLLKTNDSHISDVHNTYIPRIIASVFSENGMCKYETSQEFQEFVSESLEKLIFSMKDSEKIAETLLTHSEKLKYENSLHKKESKRRYLISLKSRKRKNEKV